MSIPAYKKIEKERNMKAVALRNRLNKLNEQSKKEGKEGKCAFRQYENLIKSTPYVSSIYVVKDESKKKKDK